MQKKNVQTVKGTRDFNAIQITQRQHIIGIIRQVYENHGFAPIETPALEHLSTLSGQYGQEGDALIFRVINSGNFLQHLPDHALSLPYTDVLPSISEKGLRYDLTVPFMRYVATHYNELVFPFKRYQIQPVWRADRPQKGRYREFYQCDADVVGTASLLLEAEMLSMAYDILKKLKLYETAYIQINHRAILQGLSVLIGAENHFSTFCTIIDKIDKIGLARVLESLQDSGFDATPLHALFTSSPTLDNQEIVQMLGQHLKQSTLGTNALQEIQQILSCLEALHGHTNLPIKIVPSLARGLSYYTGTIFEIKTTHTDMGSIAGGGRYDRLGCSFGQPALTGVGLSFGLDRIYALMEHLQLFPNNIAPKTKVMIANFDEKPTKRSLHMLRKLRDHEISSEIYPESTKLKKQLQYAHKKEIPFVLFIEEDAKGNESLLLKNMQTGVQTMYDIENVIAHVRNI